MGQSQKKNGQHGGRAWHQICLSPALGLGSSRHGPLGDLHHDPGLSASFCQNQVHGRSPWASAARMTQDSELSGRLALANRPDNSESCVWTEEQGQRCGWLLEHVQSLCLPHLNREKSMLVPCQVMEFLGMVIDFRTTTVSLTQERQEAFRACLAHFCLGARVTWRLCLQLLGLMAAMVQILLLAHIFMHPVQRCLLSLELDSH